MEDVINYLVDEMSLSSNNVNSKQILEMINGLNAISTELKEMTGFSNAKWDEVVEYLLETKQIISMEEYEEVKKENEELRKLIKSSDSE